MVFRVWNPCALIINRYGAEKVVTMASRRFVTMDTPVREVNLQSAKLFQSDLDFLQSRGIPVRSVLREALHEHVLRLKSRAVPVMTTEQRAAFIMNGQIPTGKVSQD
jgi:hypothetical protein